LGEIQRQWWARQFSSVAGNGFVIDNTVFPPTSFNWTTQDSTFRGNGFREVVGQVERPEMHPKTRKKHQTGYNCGIQ
jgi:hypothetical protein